MSEHRYGPPGRQDVSATKKGENMNKQNTFHEPLSRQDSRDVFAVPEDQAAADISPLPAQERPTFPSGELSGRKFFGSNDHFRRPFLFHMNGSQLSKPKEQ